jgi:hypothetical protein
MPAPFDLILVTCAAAGLFMVIGSIALLYKGAIQLSEKDPGQALEAEFKDQLRVNVRTPALALFVIGFAFFGLALFFAKPPESESVVIKGHIKIADIEGLRVTLISDAMPISVESDGEILATIQPVEHLSVLIEPPPGYQPHKQAYLIKKYVKHGQFEIPAPEFTHVSENVLATPKPDFPRPKMPTFK